MSWKIFEMRISPAETTRGFDAEVEAHPDVPFRIMHGVSARSEDTAESRAPQNIRILTPGALSLGKAPGNENKEKKKLGNSSGNRSLNPRQQPFHLSAASTF